MDANGNGSIPLVAPVGGLRFAGKNYREGQKLPEKYRRSLQASSRPVDPGQAQRGAAPNFGRAVVPHVVTFRGLTSSLAKAYRPSDDALRDSVQHAHIMLADPMISGPLQARQTMTALLDWHIESEDDQDPELKAAAQVLTKVLRKIPYFTEYRRSLMEAIWYGRTAIQNRYGWHVNRHGERMCVIRRWTPISGDKLVFRYDDGSGDFDPDQWGVKVSSARGKRDKITGDRHLELSGEGMAYFLEPWEARLFTLHRHMVRDGEYEDPLSAGHVHGVGLRHFLYWCWYQKQETLRQLVELVERTGSGFTIYRYPYGNDQAKREIDAIAEEQSHTNIIKLPSDPADPDAYGIEQIPPDTSGVTVLHELIDNYWGDLIIRFILGQTLSSKAGATGLGSGLADLQGESLSNVVKYDAVNLEETITREILIPARNFNLPKYRNVEFFFRISTESNLPEQKLAAIRQAWDMGAEIRTSDIFDRIGLTIPKGQEPRLKNPAFSMTPSIPGATPDASGPGEGAGPSETGPPNASAPGMQGQPPAPGPDAAPAEDPQADERQQLFGPVLNEASGGPDRYWQVAGDVDTDPSDAQKEAGNYRKGKLYWNGLQIAVENPKGSERSGDGWSIKMPCHYGYIRRTMGADGDQVDVFLGPHPKSDVVFVVDAVTKAGGFDEHKVMLGFLNNKLAKRAYLRSYPKGWRCGKLTAMTVQQFRAWLRDGDQDKPVRDQVAKYGRQLSLFDDPPHEEDPTDDPRWNVVPDKGTGRQRGLFDSPPKATEPPKPTPPKSQDEREAEAARQRLRDHSEEEDNEFGEDTEVGPAVELTQWDPKKHPRHPVGSPDSHGGQFAPKDEAEAGGDHSPDTGEMVPEPKSSIVEPAESVRSLTERAREAIAQMQANIDAALKNGEISASQHAELEIKLEDALEQINNQDPSYTPPADANPAPDDANPPQDEPKPAPDDADPPTVEVEPKGEPAKPAPAGTPRGEAQRSQYELESDFEFSRRSSVGNRGEDLSGSARHKRNAWRTMAEAEAAGSGVEFCTRRNLLLMDPVDFVTPAQDHPLSALSMSLLLQKFPSKPKAPKRKEDPEIEAEHRQLYAESLKELSHKFAAIATEHEDPFAALKAAQGAIKVEMEKARKIYRDAPGSSKDFGRRMYNSLVSMSNSAIVSRYRPKASDIAGQLGQLMEFTEKQTESKGDQVDLAREISMEVCESGRTMQAELKRRGADIKGGKQRQRVKMTDYYGRTAIRTGGREGAYTTANEATDFMVDTMGMRGVQWGNSVTDDERKYHAKQSSDAMLDLMDVLELDDEGASLGGRLGLAIGARGRAGALAHYEPGSRVINLTRKNGAGSLAHEWGHFFDDIASGGKGAFASTDRVATQTPGIREGMRSLAKSWKDSGYTARLSDYMSKEHGYMTPAERGYWTSPEEMFARTFERFVQRKLQKTGRRNTYLVGLRKEGGGAFWPTDAEVDEMVPHMESIFNAYREKVAATQQYRRRAMLDFLDRYAEWNESDHPRHASGDSRGGEFESGHGAGKAGTTETIQRFNPEDRLKRPDNPWGEFYHGGTQGKVEFSHGRSGGIFFTSDPDIAFEHVDRGSGEGEVVRAQLRMRNPLDISEASDYSDAIEQMADSIGDAEASRKARGYSSPWEAIKDPVVNAALQSQFDGLMVPDDSTYSTFTSYVVFDNQNINITGRKKERRIVGIDEDGDEIEEFYEDEWTDSEAHDRFRTENEIEPIVDRYAQMKLFEESEHPRDDGGKFTTELSDHYLPGGTYCPSCGKESTAEPVGWNDDGSAAEWGYSPTCDCMEKLEGDESLSSGQYRKAMKQMESAFPVSIEKPPASYEKFRSGDILPQRYAQMNLFDDEGRGKTDWDERLARLQQRRNPSSMRHAKSLQRRDGVWGEVSSIDGEFYKVGQFMPVHGQSVKEDPKPKKKKADKGESPPAASEDGKGRGKQDWNRGPASADEIERRQHEKRWSIVQQGPVGDLLRLGEKPHHVKHASGGTKVWAKWAEDQGLTGEDMRGISEWLWPKLEARESKTLEESPIPGLTTDEASSRYKEHLETIADDSQQYWTKKHIKSHPDSPLANVLWEEWIGQAPDQLEAMEELHRFMSREICGGDGCKDEPNDRYAALKKYRVMGTTDDHTTCDQCGRENLKKTVVMEVLDAEGNGTGSYLYFGTDCAARASGRKQAAIEAEARRGDHVARVNLQREKNKKANEFNAKWDPKIAALLDELVPEEKGQRARQVSKLGFHEFWGKILPERHPDYAEESGEGKEKPKTDHRGNRMLFQQWGDLLERYAGPVPGGTPWDASKHPRAAAGNQHGGEFTSGGGGGAAAAPSGGGWRTEAPGVKVRKVQTPQASADNDKAKQVAEVKQRRAEETQRASERLSNVPKGYNLAGWIKQSGDWWREENSKKLVSTDEMIAGDPSVRSRWGSEEIGPRTEGGFDPRNAVYDPQDKKVSPQRVAELLGMAKPEDAAQHLGLDPQSETFAEDLEEASGALDAISDVAQSFGWEGATGDIQNDTREAVNHIVNEASTSGWKPDRATHAENLVSALEHLNQKSQGGIGDESLKRWVMLASLVVGFLAMWSMRRGGKSGGGITNTLNRASLMADRAGRIAGRLGGFQ